MGCGCNKRKQIAQSQGLVGSNPQTVSTRTAGRVAVYNVLKDGQTVLETTSPTAARQEARRLGASVKVTSRETTQEEQDAGLVPARAAG